MTVKKQGDFAITRDSLYGTTNEPTYAGVTSFMRRKYTQDLDGVDLVVTGVPLDTATTNRPGTRFGPRSIRNASSMISWMRPYDTEVDPFDKLAIVDYGDCFFDFGRPDTIPDAIEQHATNIISQGPGLLTLGGESIAPFSIALIVGIIVGTYSSIYTASATALLLGVNAQDLLEPIKDPDLIDDLP